MIKSLLSFCAFLIVIQSLGQNFELTGQIRPRAEYKHGYKTLISEGIDPAFAISQRTRLNLGYNSEKMKAMVSFQDVRIWGDAISANKSDLNGTMLYQAWGEFFLKDKFSVKAGRQPIQYDDQRLFGAADWNQQARSHDALVVKYNPSKSNTIQAGFAFNQSSEKDTGTFYTLEKNYKALQYLYLHKAFGKHVTTSLFLINLGMPHSTLSDSILHQETNYYQTLGGLVSFNPEKLKSSFAFYYQMGKNQKSKTKSAYFIGADLSYPVFKYGSLGAGIQYLSGNDQVDPAEEDQEFSTVFSTGHKFNGWMDYFYAGNSHQGVGLLDIYLPIILKKEKLSSEIQVHYYRSAASVIEPLNPQLAMDSYLGSEAGIMLSYAFSPEMTVSGGYSQIFGSETLEVLKGGDSKQTQNWAWVMLTFNPVFLKTFK